MAQIQSDMIRIDPARFLARFEIPDQEWMAEKFFHDIWSNLIPIDSKFEREEALDELYKDTPSNNPSILFYSKKLISFFVL